MSIPAIHVTKIGGSLLDLPDLPTRWRQWRDPQKTIHQVVVVGGGMLVDALRQQALHRSISDDLAHWSAVDLMAVNTRLLASQLVEHPICAAGPHLEDRLTTAGGTFVDVVHFLRTLNLFSREANLRPTGMSPAIRLRRGWLSASMLRNLCS